MQIPRILISASNSSSGKTMLTCGIARALRMRGYEVQTFKVGPDFIDPKYLSLASGRRAVNLDSWLMSEEEILRDFEKYCEGADLALIEGVRSLYDSSDPLSLKGSTFSVAKILKAPILLTVDIRGLNMGTAAIVKGFASLFSANIQGVILNSSRGERHEFKAKKAVEELAKIKVLGAIPRKKELEISMRHLGLITVEEIEKEVEEKVKKWAEIVEERLDLDELLKIAESAEELPEVKERYEKKNFEANIAIALDKSFNFYYAQNLDKLKALGAKLSFFSTLEDELFEEIDGIMIGGGYPEVFAKEFNKKTMRALKNKIEDDCPTYAECGGLMFLCKKIVVGGEKFEGVGLIPAEAILDLSKRFLGYTKAKVVEENVISGKGEKLLGHEFHYSYLDLENDMKYAYELERGYGIDGIHDGIIIHNCLASYMHMLFPKESVGRFLEKCKEYRSS
ncbi:MAG: hydrogenobyrinic acid a,c-diamide synthase (glutamine-hydrolyzing) [Archaeoglobaceae archaeon]|nr:hydrogenobyrinic acid a,c-diamide synthase (glutamine-hydrolyzing) [Archaeoglobaceae archaeon]MDW8128201.1 cobyrinate a,c-diamide synthase [Archaeoglobaceae archaeon]